MHSREIRTRANLAVSFSFPSGKSRAIRSTPKSSNPLTPPRQELLSFLFYIDLMMNVVARKEKEFVNQQTRDNAFGAPKTMYSDECSLGMTSAYRL